jgi:hypothetical protein
VIRLCLGDVIHFHEREKRNASLAEPWVKADLDWLELVNEGRKSSVQGMIRSGKRLSLYLVVTLGLTRKKELRHMTRIATSVLHCPAIASNCLHLASLIRTCGCILVRLS